MKLVFLLLRRLSMERKNTHQHKLNNILIVVLAWIVGSSFIAGCVTTSASKISDPSVISRIKIGVTTKAEVRNLLGNPRHVSTSSVNNNSTTETWFYGDLYDPNYANKSATRSFASGQAVNAGSGMIISKLPLGALTGTGGFFTQTVLGLANTKAFNGMSGHADLGETAMITFVDGVVKSATYQGRHKYAAMKSTTTSRHSGSATDNMPKTPVYTAHNSRTYHRSNCPELDTTDVITFTSSQKARECGGTPCKHCNPS
jgi:hypothetical protein